MSDMKPRLVGGFGEINFGKQYRQGNRIYDADAIAVCLTAQPLGNMGGYSSLYVVRRKKSKKDGECINEKQSSWYGIFAGGGCSPTICAGTHGYAIGYIVVKNFPSGRNNRRK